MSSKSECTEVGERISWWENSKIDNFCPVSVEISNDRHNPLGIDEGEPFLMIGDRAIESGYNMEDAIIVKDILNKIIRGLIVEELFRFDPK